MDYRDLIAKNEFLIQILNRILFLKQRNKTVADYLRKEGIKTVSIWGCSDIGQRLYDELKESEIKIICGIDGKPAERNLPVETVNATKENASFIAQSDAIIITAVFNLTEILDNISELNIHCKIYSIDKILMEM